MAIVADAGDLPDRHAAGLPTLVTVVSGPEHDDQWGQDVADYGDGVGRGVFRAGGEDQWAAVGEELV